MKTIIKILREVALAVIGAVVIGVFAGAMKFTPVEGQDLAIGILVMSWSIFIALKIILILEDYVNN